MTAEPLPITSERLEDMRRRARAGGLDELASAIDELLYWRRLFARLYHAIPDVPGTEHLQAELERQAGRLGVIKPAKSDMH